ncbi:MAG TPA: LPS assembly protein LptD [Stellaceae bacterium]|nr:LPS assembly protein LptD [Stellaceae bacterium]
MSRPPRHGRKHKAQRALRAAIVLLFGLWCGSAPAENFGVDNSAKNAPMTFQADEVQYDDQQGLTIAKGHVEIAQGQQILLADVVTYNQHTDTVTASGHVSVMTPDGTVIFSNYMELRNGMNDLFANNVRMLMSDRSRLAANAARRTNGMRTEMRRAVYSPCDLCKTDPTAPPAWQLKAREMTDDKDLQRLEFRDATMEIDGFPVFYTPYMSAPDPSVKRADGFLMPTFGGSSEVGFHIATPYFLTLGPSADVTITPRFTTEAGTVLAADYRQRFSNGFLEDLSSINYSNVGTQIGGIDDPNAIPGALRWHVNAIGEFDLDDTYRTGFQVQRVSDQTYLQRFSFTTPPFASEVTRAYLEGFPANGSLDLNAYMFEPLTPGLGDSTQPIVLPAFNRDWNLTPDVVGGNLTLNTNLLNIVRESGTNTRRLSLGAEWDRTFYDGIGGEYKFQASARGDAYSVSSLSNLSNPDLPSVYFAQNGKGPLVHIPYDFVAVRDFPQVGLTWDYPLVHRGTDYTFLLRPEVATFAGPNSGNRYIIPDEDSLGYEFRDSDLFRADRLQGYDILDTGQRVDYGLNLGAYAANGGSYRMLIGQSYRAETNPFLPPGSGADQRLSDVVGRVTLSPSSYLDLIYRFRLDKATLANRLQEVTAAAGPQAFRVGATYLLIPAELPSQVITVPGSGETILYGKREQLNFNATIRLSQYWSLVGAETLNLTNSANIVNGITTPQSSSASLQASLSALYQDECMGFIATVSQSGIRNGDVTPGYGVLLSVVFKNIGEIGGTVFSASPGT